MSHHHRIALTWWGSGGHILPLISLLQTINDTRQYKQLIDNVYRFGEKASMEQKFFDQYQHTFDQLEVKFVSIMAGKYRRETIWQSRLNNIRDLLLFPIGVVQSLYWLIYHRIDAVFCKWWYVSLPVVIAARILRKKIYVHDSDTTPWLTTRLASHLATQNFSGFPDTLPRSVCVGQILSDRLVGQLVESWKSKVKGVQSQVVSSKQQATSSKASANSTIQILVAGWSLWAQKLYNAVLSAFHMIENKWLYHITIINGNHLIDRVLLHGIQDYITITDMIMDQSEMWRLYAQSDMAIVRGGTTTLAECKLFDLPLVIVPLPVTHDQAKNAQFYVENHNDICISQNSSDFVSQLTDHIAKTQPKHTLFDPQKIKEKIWQAKTIILDRMLGISR